MAEVTDVTDASFEGEVLKSETPVLVDSWAEGGDPFRAIAPIVTEIADDNGKKLNVVSQPTGTRPEGDFRELVDGIV